jgi:tRNA/rRNA methyltransferase
MPLDNFAFVLFKPKSPGNIGAAARALKNMGCRDLRIVQPAGFHFANDRERTWSRQGPGSDDAQTMAVHGRDVLAAATIHPGLDSALADRTLVVGTTARAGPYRSEARLIREVSDELSALSRANRIALVFGPEDCGLTNEELKLCQRLITIPTAPEYPSLNLAQAVMIVAYELMLAAGAARELPLAQQWAGSPEVDAMLARMATALVAIGFLPEDNPGHIMFALRAILGRAGLRPRELDIMNGIASQILWFSESGYDTLARKRSMGKKLR